MPCPAERAADERNLVLIGMPGAGKSTVGRLLAARLGWPFLDTDALIESAAGSTLQSIVDCHGHEVLRAAEADVLQALDCRGHVIATGGSAVYADAGMRQLRLHGRLIHLRIDWPTLRARVADFSARGLAKPRGQSLQEMFAERGELYARHADIVVEVAAQTPEEVCAAILQALKTQA